MKVKWLVTVMVVMVLIPSAGLARGIQPTQLNMTTLVDSLEASIDSLTAMKFIALEGRIYIEADTSAAFGIQTASGAKAQIDSSGIADIRLPTSVSTIASGIGIVWVDDDTLRFVDSGGDTIAVGLDRKY